MYLVPDLAGPGTVLHMTPATGLGKEREAGGRKGRVPNVTQSGHLGTIAWIPDQLEQALHVVHIRSPAHESLSGMRYVSQFILRSNSRGLMIGLRKQDLRHPCFRVGAVWIQLYTARFTFSWACRGIYDTFQTCMNPLPSFFVLQTSRFSSLGSGMIDPIEF